MLKTMTFTTKSAAIKPVGKFISKKNNADAVIAFLNFAAENRVLKNGYRFIRETCYDG